MIKTPRDIVNQALKRSGVSGGGQTPSANDINDGFDEMNLFISLLQPKRWLCWAEEDIAAISTGATSYTIGPGQQFNCPRPDRIEAAYIRLLPISNNQPFDRSLDVIQSREDYSALTLKNLQAWPTNLYYDTQFPVGNIFPYPVPMANQYEIHLIIKDQILPFTSLSQNLSTVIPPMYLDALIWNLAARIRPAYGLGPDETVTSLAVQTLNVIRQANVQIPTLGMPSGFPVGRNRGDFWPAGMIH